MTENTLTMTDKLIVISSVCMTKFTPEEYSILKALSCNMTKNTPLMTSVNSVIL